MERFTPPLVSTGLEGTQLSERSDRTVKAQLRDRDSGQVRFEFSSSLELRAQRAEFPDLHEERLGVTAGRKGVTLQRYKGLGEMNPEQLWETTLDANARTLLKVHIRELDEADDIFTKLMGDVVEPRRDFIRDNALSVANLDV